MKRLLFLLLVLLSVQTFAATVYVNPSKSYYISTWNPGTGVGDSIAIDSANAEWRFGNRACGYDTSGGMHWVNYGKTAITLDLGSTLTPALAEGILGPNQSAVTFATTTERLTATSATPLQVTTGSVSVEAWLMQTQYIATTNKAVCGKRTSTTANTAGWMLSSYLGSPQFHIGNGSVGAYAGVNSSKPMFVWTHFVGVRDTADAAGTDGLYVYRDGVLQDTTQFTEISITSTAKFTIGNINSTSTTNIIGSVAIVRVWIDKVLTQAQVDSLYAHRPTGTTTLAYPSLQSAIRQAGNNTGFNTISLASGNYCETVTVFNDSVTIQASTPVYGSRPVFLGGNLPAASAGSGFTAPIGFYVPIGPISISDIDIRGYYLAQGVYADSASDGSRFDYLLLDSCLLGMRMYGSATGDTVINCTIDGANLASSYGLRTIDGEGTANLYWLNNIVTRCTNGLTVTPNFTVTANYNDVYANTTQYSGLTAGAYDLDTDPVFKNQSGNDYEVYANNLHRSGLGWWKSPNYPTRGALTWLTSLGTQPIYVDRAKNYFITTWGTGAGLISIPASDVSWWFGNGTVGYDTSGGWNFVNHGVTALGTQLDTVSVIPNLEEGPLRANQSSVNFSGVTGSQLQISDGGVLNTTIGSLTIEVWALHNLVGTQTLISKRFGTGDTSPGFRLSAKADNKVFFGISDGTNLVNITSAAVLELSKWHHYVIEIDTLATADSVRLYLNGVLTVSADASAVVNIGSTTKFTVGALGAGTGVWNGNIAVVRIWIDKVLTQAQVDSLYIHRPIGTNDLAYPSLQSAIRQSNNLGFQYLHMVTGNYYETVAIATDSLRIQGTSPFGLRPKMLGGNLLAASGTVGLYAPFITTVSNLDIGGYFLAQGVFVDSASDGSRFDYLVIDSCLTAIQYISDANTDSVYNCTIDGNSLASSYGIRMVNTNDHPHDAMWMNNIVTNCGTGLKGVLNATYTSNYNDLFGNGLARDSISLGVKDLAVNPKFNNSAINDYRPRALELHNTGLSWWGGYTATPDIGALPGFLPWLASASGYMADPWLRFGIRRPLRFGIYLK